MQFVTETIVSDLVNMLGVSNTDLPVEQNVKKMSKR